MLIKYLVSVIAIVKLKIQKRQAKVLPFTKFSLGFQVDHEALCQLLDINYL
jgi:hypothetical protein